VLRRQNARERALDPALPTNEVAEKRRASDEGKGLATYYTYGSHQL
jgi:hypothetical protein